MAAYKAFREPGLISDPLAVESVGDFCDFETRRTRYAIYWSFYQNNVYRNLNTWAKTYKTTYGLYKHIRGIYNPAFRLVEFWKTHLWGGPLDSTAGATGALPIETETEALRLAIANVWKWSNWAINKDIFTLHGAILGDVALQVVDDVERGKVYLKRIHPGIIETVDLDPFGHVKAYCFREQRRQSGSLQVEYVETAERVGDDVVFKTFLNGKPHDWSGQGTEWRESYGFVPLVIVQHNNVGLDWGWSEFHPDREKIHEVDDLASKFHDQIRKIVEAPWLMAGVQKPNEKPTAQGTRLTDEQATKNPEPGREEIPMFYGPVGATATPLVAPLDIAATTGEIKEVIAEIERDYPELKVDILRASGEVSGRALRIAQQPAEDKVQQRRANYDNALVRAQQMATAIGGLRNYEGFTGFGLESYADGKLDHSIGKRPVFAEDPMDKTEIETAFWTAANGAIKAGIPVLVYLKRQGWTDADITALTSDPEWQTKSEMQTIALQMQRTVAGGGDGGGRNTDKQGEQDNA